MTNTIVTTDTTAAITLDGADELYTSPDGSVIRSTGNAVTINGDLNYLTIDGLLVANESAIEIDSGDQNAVYVSDTGRLVSLSFTALDVAGTNAFVTNDGTITGTFGVIMSSSGGDLINRGIIAGTTPNSTGVATFSSGTNVDNSGFVSGEFAGFNAGSGTALTNSGEISGGYGIRVSTTLAVDILNTGLVTGQDGRALNSFVIDSAISVENGGGFIGDVVFGDGADEYRGFGDGYVLGEVLGQAGKDVLYGSRADDVFDGGADGDDVRGRAGDDIVTGGRDDDIVAGNTGDDRVDGNQGNDTLFGNRGDDIVRGGSGDDRISGGRGDDVLVGNSGADVFVFNRRTDDDIIMDYQNNLDTLDLSAFGLANVAALRNAGGIVADGAGSIIDLTVIGGDGVIYVDDMAVTDWTGADFIL